MVNETITFPVLGNDIDTAGAISVTQQPANGSLSVGGKQLTFTPNNGVSGYSVGKIKVDWLDGSSDTANIEFYIEQVGKETNVDSAGGVQSAINSASSGDRIYLKGGQTYNLELVIQNIGGTPDAPIVLGSYGGGRATLKSSSGQPLYFSGNVGMFIIENIDIISNNNSDGALSWNDPGNNMNVVFDNVEISGAGGNGINWQERGSGSLTVVHSNIHDNGENGILGGADDTKILNSVVSRNHDTKDYNGGPMAWNVYVGPIDNSLHIEGNTLEDSEGLIKLRAPSNYVVQKNTLRRGWIIGISGGGKSDKVMDNGLIAYNYIADSGNPITIFDADAFSNSEGIVNLDIRNNVAVKAHEAGGFSFGGALSMVDYGDKRSTGIRIFDNIFWADPARGHGGALVGYSNAEFYNNVVGGGATSGFNNYVMNFDGSATPDVHDNVLYKFHANTSLGVALTNGNTETTSIPQEVQAALDNS